MTDNKPEGQFRSGFISIIGRPNVGKSTLLNRILGEKIVITSDKPQTTRNRIQGIHNVADGQMIFIDTPGIHKAESRFNKNMVDTALASIKEVDVILFLVDPTEKIGEVDLSILQALKNADAPVILVLNKVDVAGQSLQAVKEKLTSLISFQDVVEVSALRGKGVDDLVAKVFDLLPAGPMYFPDDIITDVPERFVVAEIVREKVFRLTREEIPYSVAVVVESFKEREDGLISIAATINVERDSQKGIIIGGKGAMLKKIGSDARRDIETFLQTRVFLELFVRVTKNWSENPRILKEFGYE